MSTDDASLSAQVNKLNTEDPSGDDTAPGELVAVVDDLLKQLSSKFSNLSNEMIAKMDEMSRRLDNLESTVQATLASKDADGEN